MSVHGWRRPSSVTVPTCDAAPAGPRRPSPEASRPAVLAVGLVLAAGFAACGFAGGPTPEGSFAPPAGPSSVTGSPLETRVPRTTWVLTSGTVRGRPILLLPDHPITLVMGATELSGTSACNSYWARLERTGPNLRFTDIVATVMRCGDDVMVSDEAFLAALPLVTRIDDQSHDVLVLEGAEVRLLFSPASVEVVGG